MDKYSEMGIRQEKVERLIKKIETEGERYMCKLRNSMVSFSKEEMTDKELSNYGYLASEYFYLSRLMEYIKIPGVFMEYEILMEKEDCIVYSIPNENIDIFLDDDFLFVIHFLSNVEMEISDPDERVMRNPYNAVDIFSFLNARYFAYSFLNASEVILYREKKAKEKSSNE